MILIVSDQFDVHADKVIVAIKERGAHVARLNIDLESLQNTYATYSNGHVKFEGSGFSFDSTYIRRVWMRRSYVEIPFELQSESSEQRIWKGEWNKFISGFFVTLADCAWMNDPKFGFRAENKYLQMATAKQIGFSIPDSIVTNKKEAVKAFALKHNGAIVKLMSQQIHKTSDGIKGVYANFVKEHEFDHFSPEGENPLFLQKYIEKLFEVRCTYVDGKIFYCRIDSQNNEATKIDWRRYNLPKTPHAPITAPASIDDMVRRLMKSLGLVYGALDFIVTPSHEWYFLEVNPMGQWLWIEDLTGLPISTAIADWLMKEEP